MSIIGAAITVMADVVTNVVRSSKVNKKIKSLKKELKKGSLEYEKALQNDYMKSDEATQAVDLLNAGKKSVAAASQSLFSYEGMSSAVSAASQSNFAYNKAIKGLVETGKKKKMQTAKDYKSYRNSMANKITAAELTKYSPNGAQIAVDFINQAVS